MIKFRVEGEGDVFVNVKILYTPGFSSRYGPLSYPQVGGGEGATFRVIRLGNNQLGTGCSAAQIENLS